MNPNDLRCPQCGSPVLATANYCVICGVRLPEPTAQVDSGATGWDTAHSPNQPISSLPPIEIPEFDEEAPEALAVAADENSDGSDEYTPIPDVALDELDAYLSTAAVVDESDDDDDGESESDDTVAGDVDDDDEDDDDHDDDDDRDEDDDEEDDDDEDDVGGGEDDGDDDDSLELDVATMIDEGAPVESPDPDEADRTHQPANDDSAMATSDGTDLGNGDVDEASPADSSDHPTMSAEQEAAEMIEEGSPVVVDPDADPSVDADPSLDEVGDDEPEVVEEAIEMIDEGAPVYPGESTYAPDDEDQTVESAPETTASDADVPEASADPPGFVTGLDDEPAPMISASYPAAERRAGEPQPTGSYWRASGDEDWVFSELERSSEERSATAPASVRSDEGNQAAIARAGELIEELRTILPQLAKSGSTVSGTDLAELRTLAIAARGEQSFDDWAALRQVVGAAAGRSPDIETILQLSKRVDDIAALIDERDRLQQSFEKITAWIDRNSPDRD